MGQYYLLANVSKREYIHPHRLGFPAKLWEIMFNKGVAGVLLAALAIPDSEDDPPFVGRWAGDQVIVVGDEMDWPYVSHMIKEGKIDLPSWMINELKEGYIPPEEGEDIDSYLKRVRQAGGIPTLYSLVVKHFRDISVEALKFLYRVYPEDGLYAARLIIKEYKEGFLGPQYVLELLEDEAIYQALQKEMGEEIQRILSHIKRSYR
ncbi:MAG: hypothetical protein JHC25_03805 [Thermodesulfobacterium sp.]|nr:hypothetical protein [Thermodesulfobacterium sp.]